MQHNDDKAGIYIHIPFCHKACHYCNFHFSTSVKQKPAYVEALLKEIALRSDYAGGRRIGSVYFGGGTPSLLDADELQRIMQALHTHYPIDSTAEITLEANPDDIHADAVRVWKEAGINRLSIGIQSFRDADLKRMNRTHSGAEALASISMAQAGGITNISGDLIYGLPELDDAAWLANIDMMVGAGVQHISCYALTIEPKTALAHFIASGKEQAPDDVQTERQFHLMRTRLLAHGFIHYEISNFCLPRYQAAHNSGYWRGMYYIGLGASAHGYNGKTRQWNFPNNPQYIRAITTNTPSFEIEYLNTSMQMHELIMVSLRTAQGLDLEAFTSRFGSEARQQLLDAAAPLIQEGVVYVADAYLHIDTAHWFIADSIIAHLFFDVEA